MSAAARPLIKICGITRTEDARLAVELGADLIGLNFHPPSPRFVDSERARQIADAVRGETRIAGVFVDRPAGEVERVAAAVGLDLVQFHGDETPERVALAGGRAIKAFRLDDSWVPEELDRYPEVWGFLAEARHPELYGGSGQSWSYEKIAGLAAAKPVLLAGGIRPANVREALRLSGASGVDICSGVESVPGLKDPVLLRELFREVEGRDE